MTPPESLSFSRAPFCLVIVLLVLVSPLQPFAQSTAVPSAYAKSRENSSATFYGGYDGTGTINGACGYEGLNATSIGLMNAAASVKMWNNGAICGACFLIKCRGSNNRNFFCRWGASVTVTVTNACPQGSDGGWCNKPKRHLDMSYPAWAKIATESRAGVVSTYMQRVPCARQGGLKFRLGGNKWWHTLLVQNVGGSGDLVSIEVSTNRGKTWVPFRRDWGAVWSIHRQFLGRSLSFRLLTGFVRRRLVVLDAVPATWQLGREYSTRANFKSL